MRPSRICFLGLNSVRKKNQREINPKLLSNYAYKQVNWDKKQQIHNHREVFFSSTAVNTVQLHYTQLIQ